MEYTLLTDKFGGMNLRADPAVIGPGMAQDVQGVDVAGGVAVNDKGVLFSTLAYSVTSCGTLGGEQVLATNSAARDDYDFGMPFVYGEYGGRAIRIPRAPVVADWVPQYTTSASSPVWHALGIKKPAIGSFAMASGGAGSLTGSYLARVVFYNAFGDESPPTASVSFAATSNDIDYSNIPIGYGQGDITNESTTITNVDNPTLFRVGMRITSPTVGIPAGTYVTAINAAGSTLTISQAATATTANIELQDAQVTGRRIYRTTASGSTYHLAVDIPNVTATTSASDNTTDAALALLDTLAADLTDDTLPGCWGGTVSPDGVLMAVISEGLNQVLVFTKTDSSFLWNATYTIDTGATCSQVFYAINRFIVFTQGVLYFVLGSGVSDFDLIKTSAQAPVFNGATYYGGANPVEMPDGSVWFTSVMGVTRYDGSTAEAITRDLFTENQNASLGNNAYAAVVDRGRYILVSSIDSRTTYRGLIFDPAVPGWRWLTPGDSSATSRTTGAAWVDLEESPPRLYYYLGVTQCVTHPAYDVGTNGVYWSGEWSGQRRSSLKKFRRVSVMHNGSVTVQPYVDGAVAGSAQALVRTTLGRSVFFLPSATKGRVCSVKLTLVSNTAEVHEVCVWVGEERGPMP